MLLSLTTSFGAYAKEKRVVIKDSEGKSFKIGIESYQNAQDILEVRIDAAGIPKFLDKLNPTIAYGRDLDDNKKIDTWFFITNHGIEVEQMEGNDPLGEDILPALILKKHQTSAGVYVSSALTTVFSYVLLSANEAQNLEARYYRDWMDLEEVRIRFESDTRNGVAMTPGQIRFHHQLMSYGFNSIHESISKFGKRDLWGWMAADVGLWISGGIVFKMMGVVLAKAGVAITESSMMAFVENRLGQFLDKQKAVLKEKMAAISEKMPKFKKSSAGSTTAEIGLKLTKANFNAAMSSAIISSVAKKRIMKVVQATTKWPVKIFKGALSEWKYIAMNMSVQVGSETAAHWDNVYDPNPLVLAKNVLTNPEIQQNVGFMTTDTILMTGIAKSLKTTKAQFLASGFVGLSNSMTVNLVIKKEDNYERVALDTAWESIVGNAQVQLDMKALSTFEKMAAENKNPKLKLIGYALVLIDTGAGYFLYSKASTLVNEDMKEKKEANLQLVPVMVEQG